MRWASWGRDGRQTSVTAAAAAARVIATDGHSTHIWCLPAQLSGRTDGNVQRIAQRKYIGRRAVITIHHPSRPHKLAAPSEDSIRAARTGPHRSLQVPTRELRCLLRYNETRRQPHRVVHVLPTYGALTLHRRPALRGAARKNYVTRSSCGITIN